MASLSRKSCPGFDKENAKPLQSANQHNLADANKDTAELSAKRQKKSHDARIRKEAEEAAIAARAAEEEYLREVELAEVARKEAKEAATQVAKGERLKQEALEEAAFTLSPENAGEEDCEAKIRDATRCKTNGCTDLNTPKPTLTGEQASVSETGCEVTLEEYKKVIDATTEIQPLSDEIECGDEITMASVHDTEWKDAITGAMLGYAACTLASEDSQAELDVESSVEYDRNTEPLQVTVEWKEQSSGTMLGFAICDESDKELQCMRHRLGEVDELSGSSQMLTEWEDSETGAMLGYAVCDGDGGAPIPQVDDSSHENAEDLESIPQEPEGDDSLQLPAWAEWKDSGIGAAPRTPVCNESSEHDEMTSQTEDSHTGSDDHAAALCCIAEWEDLNTGVKMSYACDDESDIEDAVDYYQTSSYSLGSGVSKNQGCIVEWEDPETGTKLNYAYDQDSALGDEDDYTAWLGLEAEHVKEDDFKTRIAQKKHARRFASRVHRRRVVKIWQKRRF